MFIEIYCFLLGAVTAFGVVMMVMPLEDILEEVATQQEKEDSNVN